MYMSTSLRKSSLFNIDADFGAHQACICSLSFCATLIIIDIAIDIAAYYCRCVFHGEHIAASVAALCTCTRTPRVPFLSESARGALLVLAVPVVSPHVKKSLK